MNVAKFYEEIGGDYNTAITRCYSDERIEKYLKKFINLADIEGLKNAVTNKNIDDVFNISHDIKGMSLNLELTPLSKSISVLCDSVRGGKETVDIIPLFNTFMEEYKKFKDLISKEN